MTIEELQALTQTPGLTPMETVQVQLAVAALEEVTLLRRAIESHSAVMVRFANGMEYSIEKQFHSVR